MPATGKEKPSPALHPVPRAVQVPEVADPEKPGVRRHDTAHRNDLDGRPQGLRQEGRGAHIQGGLGRASGATSDAASDSGTNATQEVVKAATERHADALRILTSATRAPVTPHHEP